MDDWPYKPGELTAKRNGWGHYSFFAGGAEVGTLHSTRDRWLRRVVARLTAEPPDRDGFGGQPAGPLAVCLMTRPPGGPVAPVATLTLTPDGGWYVAEDAADPRVTTQGRTVGEAIDMALDAAAELAAGAGVEAANAAAV